MVAASFVRKPEDVQEIREILGEEGKDIMIISKIESIEGVQNFDAVLAESDGIMVPLYFFLLFFFRFVFLFTISAIILNCDDLLIFFFFTCRWLAETLASSFPCKRSSSHKR
jgi:hypothetical protein